MKNIKLKRNDYAFASGLKNEFGLQMVFDEVNGEIVSKLKIKKHMEGWKNITHGGIISTILDEAMGRRVLTKFQRLSLTKELTIKFVRTIPIEEEITVKAKIKSENKETNKVKTEAIIYDKQERICAKGYATFKIFPETFYI